MFRTVRLSIIISLFTQQCYMSYRFVDSFRAGPGWNSSWSCSKPVYKPVRHIPLLSVQWINSWWWTGELSETCRVSWQNKLVKLVHLVGFITQKFVTMHGDMNVKFNGSICLFTPTATAIATDYRDNNSADPLMYISVSDENLKSWLHRICTHVTISATFVTLNDDWIKCCSLLLIAAILCCHS
jgi:hypothetical protein